MAKASFKVSATKTALSADAPARRSDWAWGGRRFGNLFTGLTCLAFYVLAMLLPLVGKAGVKTEWAKQNRITFLVALCTALALAAVAGGSRIAQQQRRGGRLPILPFGLAGLGVLLFVAYALGALSI